MDIKEQSPVGGEQPTEQKPEVDETKIAPPAKEEDIDETEDLSEYGVPPMPTEEKEEEEPGSKPEENQVKTEEEKETVIPVTPPEPSPSKLDKRLAQVYVQNLLLSGEKNIPTEEQILEDLKKYSSKDKINSLNTHLAERKRLKGETPAANNFEEEDLEAIRDSEREAIRQELIQEEQQKAVTKRFIEFVDEHTELLPDDEENKKKFPNKKKYNPKLAEAVETLWKGGMQIDKAFETVTSSISLAKSNEKREAEIRKQKALSGAVGASNSSSSKSDKMTWTEFDKLRTEDPARYEKLLDEGYEPIDDEE